MPSRSVINVENNDLYNIIIVKKKPAGLNSHGIFLNNAVPHLLSQQKKIVK